jgi:hypothetical protein
LESEERDIKDDWKDVGDLKKALEGHEKRIKELESRDRLMVFPYSGDLGPTVIATAVRALPQKCQVCGKDDSDYMKVGSEDLYCMTLKVEWRPYKSWHMMQDHVEEFEELRICEPCLRTKTVQEIMAAIKHPHFP